MKVMIHEYMSVRRVPGIRNNEGKRRPTMRTRRNRHDR
jgi:hypothetical protein